MLHPLDEVILRSAVASLEKATEALQSGDWKGAFRATVLLSFAKIDIETVLKTNAKETV